MPSPLPVFDGHNDVISALLDAERAAHHSATGTDQPPRARGFFERGTEGHIDLPRARDGGFGGGLFSIYVPADPQAPPPACRKCTSLTAIRRSRVRCL